MHAYRYEGYTLIPNPIDKYAVSDLTPGLNFDADGGLTICVQSERPPGGDANWLPVAASEEFFLLIRGYEPVDVASSLAWAGPTIERVG